MTDAVCALLLGRHKSTGLPGKNWLPIRGRPMVAWPLLAAALSETVERTYVSTDSPRIREVAESFGAHVIERPPELCTDTALGEDAYAHGWTVIRGDLEAEGRKAEALVLLMANAPTITPELIDQGVRVLREQPDVDSAVSVSRYNMWSPLRARAVGTDGLLHPAVPFEAMGDPESLNCDRDSQGDVWFADMGVSVVRPRCLDRLEEGLLPQRWMGRRIAPLEQEGGCDVDYEWQIPMVEHWLSKHWPEEAG